MHTTVLNPTGPCPHSARPLLAAGVLLWPLSPSSRRRQCLPYSPAMNTPHPPFLDRPSAPPQVKGPYVGHYDRAAHAHPVLLCTWRVMHDGARAAAPEDRCWPCTSMYFTHTGIIDWVAVGTEKGEGDWQSKPNAPLNSTDPLGTHFARLLLLLLQLGTSA